MTRYEVNAATSPETWRDEPLPAAGKFCWEPEGVQEPSSATRLGNNKTMARRGQVYNEGSSRYKPLLTTASRTAPSDDECEKVECHPLRDYSAAEGLNFRERMRG